MEKESSLKHVNEHLMETWEAFADADGRLYYVSHQSQTSHWIPAPENWETTNGLPYGWESAVDKNGKTYYINHVEKVTQREDPRDDPDYVEPPKPRDVELVRDPSLGFGFVAGSEKPVIVRFVTEGGPSEDKLQPGDQIIKINSENVKNSPREYVIELVRSCRSSILLTVCQPYTDNSNRKSALLTAAKKARLKNNPSRVRFAENITVNGTAIDTPSTNESCIPFMPNVLKVFLENGQTKSFKYDNKTTIKDVLDSLQEKLSITSVEHFALVLQNMRSPSHGKMTLLQEHENLAEIAARPSSQHFKCLFRVTFVPQDAYDLLQKDPVAFEYFYMQCCNDVVKERFGSELKYDLALRLAALHLHQHAISNAVNNKVSIKAVEKECGLEKFVPHCLLESMRCKDLRKMLSHYMKQNQCLLAPGQKQLTDLQAKLHYIKIISELRSFGGKCFIATLVPWSKVIPSDKDHSPGSPHKWNPLWEKKTEAMILVGPKCGVSVVTNIKLNTLATLADYEEMDSIILTKEGDSMQRVDLVLSDPGVMPISLSMLNEDVHDFVALVEGYFRVYVNGGKNLLKMVQVANNNTDPDVPVYQTQHMVHPAPWSYLEEPNSSYDTDGKNKEENGMNVQKERLVDFSRGPPGYQEKLDYINKLSEELGIKTEDSKPNMADTKSDDLSSIILEDLHFTDEESQLALSLLDDNRNSTIDITNDVNQNDAVNSEIENNTTSSERSNTQVTWEKDDSDATVMVINRNKPVITGENQNGATGLKTFASDPVLRDRGLSLMDSSREKNLQILQNLSRANITRSSDGNLNLTRTDRTDLFLCHRDQDVENSGHGEEEDNMSDEDTESTLSAGASDLEKRPLLSTKDRFNSHTDEELGIDNENVLSCPTSESDTDSLSTPTDSPAKSRLTSVHLTSPKLTKTEAERPQSFGLHSPDQLPNSEAEFETIANSFGLHSPDQLSSELLQASYNPRMFCDGGLYLDPDIIDLTLIPPPKTPDQENLIDFTVTTNSPPPGFSDEEKSPTREKAHDTSTDSEASLPQSAADLPSPIRTKLDELVLHDQELGAQLATMDALMLESHSPRPKKKGNERESGIESESDSGNETISSEINEYQANGMQEYLACSTECNYPTQYLFKEQLVNSSDTRGHQELDASVVPAVPTMGQHQHGANEEDIEALIRRLTVPPPPKDSPESQEAPQNHDDICVGVDSSSSHGAEVNEELECSVVQTDEHESPFPSPPNLSPDPHIDEPAEAELSEMQTQIDEELQALIMPPPPVTMETELIDIPVVPPVSVITPPSSVETSPSSDNGDKKLSRQPLLIKVKPCLNPVKNLNFADSDDEAEDNKSSNLNDVRKDDNLNFDHELNAVTNRNNQEEQKLTLYLKGTKGTRVPRSDSTPENETNMLNNNKPVVAVQGKQRSQQVAPPVKERGKFNSLKSRRMPPPPPPPRRSSMSNVLISDNQDLAALSGSVTMGSNINCKSGSQTMQQSDNFTDNKTQNQVNDGSGHIESESKSQLSDQNKLTSDRLTRSQEKLLDSSININSKLKSEKHSSNPGLGVGSSQSTSPHSSSSSSSLSPGEDSHQRSFDQKLTQADRCPASQHSDATAHTLSSKSSSSLSSPQISRHPNISLSPTHSPTLLRKILRSASSGSDSPASPRSVTSSPTASPCASPKRTGAGKASLPLTRSAQRLAANSSSTVMTGLTQTTTTLHGRSNSTPDTSATYTGVLKLRQNLSSPPVRESGNNSSRYPSKLSHLLAQKNGDNDSFRKSNGEAPLCTSSPQQSPVFAKPPVPSRTKKSESDKPTVTSQLNINANHEIRKDDNNGPFIISELGNKATSKDRVNNKRPHHQHIPTNTCHVTCPVVAEIIEKSYTGEASFQEANDDVEILLSDLQSTWQYVNSADFQRDTENFQTFKDTLVIQSRQFVTDSKLLVSSATQSMDKLIINVNTSLHTLASIIDRCQSIAYTVTSDLQLESLLSKVRDVACAYKVTVNAAQAAAGKPLSDPNMKVLMRQATNLASILSGLMRVLKSLNYE